MSISVELRNKVRQRANFACEYCGVAEVDTGGELTLDHFRPQGHAGADDLGNLVYCCFRCNSYKADYWPASATSPNLWNPRQSPVEMHIVIGADGVANALAATGAFTIVQLRLNRAELIAYRRHKHIGADQQLRLAQHFDVVIALEQLEKQHVELLQQYARLLEQHQELLRIILGK